MKEKNPVEAAICLMKKWPKGKKWSMDFNKSKCKICNQRENTCAKMTLLMLKTYFKTLDMLTCKKEVV